MIVLVDVIAALAAYHMHMNGNGQVIKEAEDRCISIVEYEKAP